MFLTVLFKKKDLTNEILNYYFFLTEDVLDFYVGLKELYMLIIYGNDLPLVVEGLPFMVEV
jgi:hypothetical protein